MPTLQYNALFLSTLSLRRATSRLAYVFAAGNISIHALLAESDLASDDRTRTTEHISIHALLAESDPMPTTGHPYSRYISIHALLAESD